MFITATLAAISTLAATTASVGAAGAIAGAASGGAAVAGAGSIASIAAGAGAVLQAGSTVAQYAASKEQAEEQRKQEELRRKQMQLESDRSRREIIRQTQIQRAQGVNAVAQAGGETTGGSAYGGIIGQNVTNSSYAIRSVNENEAIGEALFDSNIRESNAASYGSLFEQGGNFGKMLSNNNLQIGRIGATLFG